MLGPVLSITSTPTGSLLLHEPSLGLALVLVKQILDAVHELNGCDNPTAFVVEQNAFHALNVARRGYLMFNRPMDNHFAPDRGKADITRPYIKPVCPGWICLEITGVIPAFELSDRSKGFECSEIGCGEIPAFTLALGDCKS